MATLQAATTSTGAIVLNHIYGLTFEATQAMIVTPL